VSAGRSASGAALPSSALPSQAFLAAVPADSREAPSPGREPRQGVVGRGCKDLYTVSETVAEATGQGGRRQRLKRRLGVYHAAPAGWNPTDRWTTARLCERGSRTLSGPCFGTFLEPSQVRGTDRVRFRVLTKWRRGESNPRPKVHPRAHLRA